MPRITAFKAHSVESVNAENSSVSIVSHTRVRL